MLLRGGGDGVCVVESGRREPVSRVVAAEWFLGEVGLDGGGRFLFIAFFGREAHDGWFGGRLADFGVLFGRGEDEIVFELWSGQFADLAKVAWECEQDNEEVEGEQGRDQKELWVFKGVVERVRALGEVAPHRLPPRASGKGNQRQQN